MARSIRNISKLGLLTDEEIKHLTQAKFMKCLMSERNDIYQEVVYNRLKDNPKDFLRFFRESSGFTGALKYRDITEEFQRALLKNGGYLTVQKMPFIYPSVMVSIFEFTYLQAGAHKSMLAKLTPKDASTRRDTLVEILKRRPYLVRADSFKCLGLEHIHYLTAIKKDGSLLSYTPKEFRDGPMYDAVLSSGKALGLIPKGHRTFARCWKAVELSSSALQYVPQEMRTQGLCEMAVAKSYSAMKYVPKELQSSSMKLKSLMKSANAKRYFKVKPTVKET